MSKTPEQAGKPTIGFIGLGLIGAPIATVMANGFHTVAFDVARKAGEKLGNLNVVADLQSVVAASDIICLSLPSPKASEDVTRAIAAAKSSRLKVIVELSTIGMQAVEVCA